MLWMYEGRPKNDPRESTMLEMEAYVHALRKEAKQLKAAANKLRSGGAPDEEPELIPPPPAPATTNAPEATTTTTDEAPDEYWTVSALRAWMNERNISYVNRDRKPELLEKISAARS